MQGAGQRLTSFLIFNKHFLCCRNSLYFLNMNSYIEPLSEWSCSWDLGLGLVGVYISGELLLSSYNLGALGVTAELCGAGSVCPPLPPRESTGSSGQTRRSPALRAVCVHSPGDQHRPSMPELLTWVLSSEQKGERG